jgi:sulfur carrier protein ThiS
MKVFIEREKVHKNISFSGTCKDLLVVLSVNSEEVLIIKNNELVSLDELCDDGDDIKLLSVVSGG